MRVHIAACVLILGAAAAFAQSFRINGLVTYSGDVPCADCVGIRYVLSLRPDGRFYRQRTYLRSESSGQVELDLGAWSLKSSTLTLVSTTHENEVFSVSSAESLLLMDGRGVGDACADQPDRNCTLTRQRLAYVPQGPYRIRGIYRESGGHRTLQPCGSGIPLPAETSGRPLLLERLSKAAAGGRPALVTVTALFEQAGRSQSGELLRIASVLTSQLAGVCSPSVPVSMADGPNTPPAAMAARPNPEPLAGTSWVLTLIVDQPPPAGIGEGEASIRFLPGGRAAGFTGCNRFNAAYTLAGRSIHFGLGNLTRMACPAGANVEIQYMKALGDARRLDLNGDSLYLLDEAGHRVAAFRAVHQP